MISEKPFISRPVRIFSKGDVLLCFPYLKVKKWHFRFELFGKVKGIKCSQKFYDWNYFLVRKQHFAKVLKANNDVDPCLYVQVHPKNYQNLRLIEYLLRRGLRAVGDVQIKVLPGHAPLELIASGMMNSFAFSAIQIAGFGTNILSALAFLQVRPHGVILCDKEAEGRIQRLWNFCFDGLIHRRELLKQRHVRKALNNLLAALC